MRDRGFTLLEILVALAIIAIVAAALSRQTGQQLNQASVLREKTAARWAVENRIQEIFTTAGPPQSTHEEKTVDINGLHLDVVTDTAMTDFPGLWRIEVSASIAGDDGPGPELVRLVAFKGGH